MIQDFLQTQKKDPHIQRISEKVEQGQRINEEDALTLFRSPHILDIGRIASTLRRKHNQNKAYYIRNGHINYSNLCTIRCAFCSFRRSEGQAGAYTMTLDQIIEKSKAFHHERIQELHIVGGLHPSLPFSYYTDMIRGLKEEHPHITIKAFTAVEIAHFSELYAISIQEVLTELLHNGLGAIPGGGAEIFAEKIRKKICPSKITGDEWLRIHKAAHTLGLKTNATMLFGHIESYEERIDHMHQIRQLQDNTQGFLSFIPLTYHPENNPLRSTRTSGLDELKTIAIARIYLDNIPHIKAYWVMLGMKLAQIALDFGADDLDGTIKEEKIYHEAGATTPQSLTITQLRELIEEAHKQPVERDSLYNAL